MAESARSNTIVLKPCPICNGLHEGECPLTGGSSTPFVAVIHDADETIEDGALYEPKPIPEWKRKYDGGVDWRPV